MPQKGDIMQGSDSMYEARGDRFAIRVDVGRRLLTMEDTQLGRRWESAAPFVRLRIPGRPDRSHPDWYWGYPDPFTLLEWRPDQLSCKALDGTLHLMLSRVPFRKESLVIRLVAVVERDRVRFEVEGVDGLPPGGEVIVDFPYRLGAARASDEGALILPRGAGVMAEFLPRTGYTFENLIYSGGQNGYSMPVFGTVKDGVILATQVKTPYDCLILGEINSGNPPAYSAGPCWLFEGGRLEYSRRADYTAFRGSYDVLAKWYRADLRAAGRCRTLHEKAEGHPLVHTLPGAALAEMHVNYTGKPGKGRTPKELVDTAHSMGFDRLVSYAVGVWQRPFQGDDNPVPRDQGTMESLAEGARYAKSVSETYYLSVYENFVDRYSITPGSDPSMMVKLRDGSVRGNWWWEPLKERSSTVCSVKREEIARRELGKLKDLIGPGSIYVDVEGAIELLECFDTVHPTTREQDAHHRFELLSSRAISSARWRRNRCPSTAWPTRWTWEPTSRCTSGSATVAATSRGSIRR